GFADLFGKVANLIKS
uniref:Signiferin-4.1 n=1 Tax=Crinia signifera TaxID=326986 RepID=SIG41_CRISI|nr:RecName: Full=Signiferin-4.1 [Crinia signifera]